MEQSLFSYKGVTPTISKTSLILSGVKIIGDVEIGDESSIWFNTVIRGDVNYVKIGKRTNIQDNSCIHVTEGGNPTIIGDDVTIGHSATIHACTIKDRSLIGMGATLLDNVVINEDSIVAAGSVVTPGKNFPKRSMIMGSPAKVKRELSDEEVKKLKESAQHYINISNNYKQ